MFCENNCTGSCCLLQSVSELAKHRTLSEAHHWRMTSVTMLVIVYLLVSAVDVDAGMCSSSSCLNGGRMIMPNSVFGYCRCRCPENFHGPKCQFVSKRVADAAPTLTADAGTSPSNVISSHDDDPLLQEILTQLHGKQRASDSLTDFPVD